MAKFMGMIEQDKILHFGLSGMLFLFFSGVTHNIYAGALGAVIVGLIKEAGDFYFRGWASIHDVWANLLGIAWAMFFTVMI